jgi:amino acid adenylation domain-containing protein
MRLTVEPTNTATVHGVFAHQAVQTPDAVAIIGRTGSLTYAQLDDRSNKLAHYLHDLGIRHGALVGITVERSPDVIVALLAILKAGAAYVPLDPSYPCGSLRVMMQDGQPSAIISHESAGNVIGVAAACGIPIIPMTNVPPHAVPADAPAPAEAIGPNDLAYVMYTSGSTGHPKGVMIPHRGIVRLVRDNDYASFAQTEVFLHLAPLTFDASTFEIWGALLNGATLAIVDAMQPSLDEIAEAIDRFGVTTMWLTAGLFHLMVDHKLDALRPLRQLLAGGDVLSPSHVKKALHALPTCRLINGYGPTENTTFTCCYSIPPTHQDGRPIPIGAAINHTDVHVLDEDFRTVAAGEVGQLCTGGHGVALGYLNRQDLTERTFVADPFSGRPGSLMYLTGDLVRRRSDGNLEFLGRMDRQVKINGKRIELEEIEETLRQFGPVRDAVTVVRTPSGTIKQIAAYVTAEPGQTPTVHALRAHMCSRLPPYMVPSVFAVMDAFPLLPSGKVDRNALPLLAVSPTGADNPASLPRGDLERALAAIWQAVLGTETISVSENFFDMGGNSLQLIEVHEGIRQQLDSKLEIIELFRYPSIRALAEHLSSKTAERPASPGVRQDKLRHRTTMGAMRKSFSFRHAVVEPGSR